jgi:hypothetical protein
LDPAAAKGGKADSTTTSSSSSSTPTTAGVKGATAKPTSSPANSTKSKDSSTLSPSAAPAAKDVSAKTAPTAAGAGRAKDKFKATDAGKEMNSAAAGAGGDLAQDKAALIASLSAAFNKDVSAEVLASRHPELGDAGEKSSDKLAGTAAAGAEDGLDVRGGSGMDSPSSSSFAGSLSQGLLPPGLDLLGGPSAAAGDDTSGVVSQKDAQVEVNQPATAAAEAVAALKVLQQELEATAEDVAVVAKEEVVAAPAAAVAVGFPKGWGPAATAAVTATATAATAMLVAGLPKGWGPRAMPAVSATGAAAAANNIVSSSSLKRAGSVGELAAVKPAATTAEGSI